MTREEAVQVPRETLTITDNRTGQTYEIPVLSGTAPRSAAIRATDLRQIKADADDGGLTSYDPGLVNTAGARSRITYIDGDRGILRYRGYAVEDLAIRSTFLETAYLLLYGELPTEEQLDAWTWEITHHTMLHESIKKFLDGFHYDAHPMGILIGTLGALSTFYPEARHIHDGVVRRKQIIRLIAKMPTLAAFAYRHSRGLPYVYPDNALTYTGNFLHMLFRTTEVMYQPNPVLARALDVLFILQADHGQDCSTAVCRAIGSAHTDPFSALAGAAAALYGPLHGGGAEGVLRMLSQIGTTDRIPGYIERVKRGEYLLVGFGHRTYRAGDPRARVARQIAEEVFGVTGGGPLLTIAREVERIARQDEYFAAHGLVPNLHFYAALIYQALGFPVEMFPVLLAIPRTVGWLAQWEEMLQDPEQKLSRPRQIYDGYERRDYLPVNQRGVVQAA